MIGFIGLGIDIFRGMGIFKMVRSGGSRCQESNFGVEFGWVGLGCQVVLVNVEVQLLIEQVYMFRVIYILRADLFFGIGSFYLRIELECQFVYL